MNHVWIFNGLSSVFPSAVFSTREKAEAWIEANQLEGTLTKYPIDVSVYEYSIRNGWFTPKQAHHFSPKFIQQFTCASQEHFHYERERDSEQELDRTWKSGIISTVPDKDECVGCHAHIAKQGGHANAE